MWGNHFSVVIVLRKNVRSKPEDSLAFLHPPGPDLDILGRSSWTDMLRHAPASYSTSLREMCGGFWREKKGRTVASVLCPLLATLWRCRCVGGQCPEPIIFPKVSYTHSIQAKYFVRSHQWLSPLSEKKALCWAQFWYFLWNIWFLTIDYRYLVTCLNFHFPFPLCNHLHDLMRYHILNHSDYRKL